MKSLLTILATICVLLVPALSQAQERVAVDVNYVGGSYGSIFTYPLAKTRTTGKKYDTDGVSIMVKVRVDDITSVGYHMEHLGLYNAQDVDQVKGVASNPEADYLFHDGHTMYQEFFSTFKLPKTGHSLIVGLSKIDVDRFQMWYEQGGVGTSNLDDHFLGMVVGGEGQQKIGPFTLNYAGRFYPHIQHTGGYKQNTLGSNGFEGQAIGAWQIYKYLTLTGTYEFRRFSTVSTPMGVNGRPWPIHENQDSNGRLMVGVRTGF